MAPEKPTSRRDFLRGKAVGRALLDATRALADRAAAALPSLEGHPSPRGSASMAVEPRISATHRAMACDFVLEYHIGDSQRAAEAIERAFAAIDAIESQLTIYRDVSEVLTLNRIAHESPVPVEPGLFSLFELAAWLHAETGGAFDPTSSPLSRTWGFLERRGRAPDDAELAAARERVGFQHIELEANEQTIRFLRPGIEINFNALGKGYALDRVAQILSAEGVDDFLCHAGRSSVLARGRDRGRPGGGWGIAIPHPHDGGSRVGEVIIRDEALGTSGSATQFFEHHGRRFGHLIDPRTGWPVEGVFTATAIAATAAEADALSTAFYILGPAGTSEFCDAHADIGAVVVCPRAGRPEEFDVHAFNLDSSRWMPADVGTHR